MKEAVGNFFHDNSSDETRYRIDEIFQNYDLCYYFLVHFSCFVLEYLLYSALFRVTGLDSANVNSPMMIA
jgi:hypothetical protein